MPGWLSMCHGVLISVGWPEKVNMRFTDVMWLLCASLALQGVKWMCLESPTPSASLFASKEKGAAWLSETQGQFLPLKIFGDEFQSDACTKACLLLQVVQHEECRHAGKNLLIVFCMRIRLYKGDNTPQGGLSAELCYLQIFRYSGFSRFADETRHFFRF